MLLVTLLSTPRRQHPEPLLTLDSTSSTTHETRPSVQLR